MAEKTDYGVFANRIGDLMKELEQHLLAKQEKYKKRLMP